MALANAENFPPSPSEQNDEEAEEDTLSEFEVDSNCTDQNYDGDDEDNWYPVNEEDERMQEESTVCLFCSDQLKNIDEAIKHLLNEHGVDLCQLKEKFHMSQYDFIKLINFIRKHNTTAESLLEATEIFWMDDAYLQPAAYEPWLCYDYDSLTVNETDVESAQTLLSDTSQERAIIDPLNGEKVQELIPKIEHVLHDMRVMRESYQRLMESIPGYMDVDNDAHLKDSNYFENYAHFQVHHDMLSDNVRTTCYHDAFMKNMDFIRDKKVLDVGCGTGILSMFAQRAGAYKVVGIDYSDIIENAKQIIKKNNIKNIELIQGRIEDVVLPPKSFDIIVSEWMGYFLLFEGMLNSVIVARNNFLKPGGLLMPNRCSLHLAGLGGKELHRHYVSFWDNVYGIDMSIMKESVIREPQVETVFDSDLITESDCIAEFDLMTVERNYATIEHKLQLKCLRDGVISGLVGYFKTYFDMPQHSLTLSTSPHDEPTHWKQVVFLLSEAKMVQAGQLLEGTFKCQTSRRSNRSLDISIELFGNEQNFYLD